VYHRVTEGGAPQRAQAYIPYCFGWRKGRLSPQNKVIGNIDQDKIGDVLMMDIIFIGLTVFFGIISWAFIVLCSKV